MTKQRLHIRPATPSDLPVILAIQNEIIATTNAVYVDEPETLAQRQAWFNNRIAQGLPIFVAEANKVVIGFASYSIFRPRAGYRYTVEHSVHVTAKARGQGAGKALLQALIDHATAEQYHAMIGVIDAENLASISFHKAFGFYEVGRFNEVAQKRGQWRDTVFMQVLLDS